jgi:hypothetical protein
MPARMKSVSLDRTLRWRFIVRGTEVGGEGLKKLSIICDTRFGFFYCTCNARLLTLAVREHNLSLTSTWWSWQVYPWFGTPGCCSHHQLESLSPIEEGNCHSHNHTYAHALIETQAISEVPSGIKSEDVCHLLNWLQSA